MKVKRPVAEAFQALGKTAAGKTLLKNFDHLPAHAQADILKKASQAKTKKHLNSILKDGILGAEKGLSRSLDGRLAGLYNRAEGAKLLARSMTSTGVVRPANTASHHLIPMSIAKEHKTLFNKAVHGGWDMNGAKNGKYLDRIMHPSGGSHPRVQGYTRKQISEWVKKKGGVKNISNLEAKNYLENLAKRMSDYFDANPGKNINELFEWIN